MSDRHGVPGVAGAAGLDRSPQLLPVPLGGLHPARRHPSTLLRHWRRHQPQVMIVISLVAGLCGVWLAADPTTSTVAFDAAGVHVDDALLDAVSPATIHGVRVFDGPASLAITTPRGGISRAGSVMTWGGLATTGQCVLVVVAAGASDACRFTIGAAHLAAADTFDAPDHVWHRRYADGVDVTIAVPAGSALIPIPFPLGH